MRKITFYILLFSALLTTDFMSAQSDFCDNIKFSARVYPPPPKEIIAVYHYVKIPENLPLPNDLKTSDQIVVGGKVGKTGTEYVLELLDENDNLITKKSVLPSKYTKSEGYYWYQNSTQVKTYSKIKLRFKRKDYSILPLVDPGDPNAMPPIPPSVIGYQQLIKEIASCDGLTTNVNPAPIPPDNRPNLTLKGFKIKKGSKTWDLMKGETPTLTNDASNAYEFTVTIENNGKVRASDVRAWIGFSSTNKYPDPSVPAYGIYPHNYGDINASSSKAQTRNVFVNNSLGSSPKLSSGQYYFIIDIDPDGKVNESKENDNIWSYPFYYFSGSPKPGDPIEPIEPLRQTANSNLQVQKPYEVQVYDIYGRKVLTKKVENQQREEAIIDELSYGYYIFKSENRTRKVAKGL